MSWLLSSAMSDSVISVENLGKRAGVIASNTRSKVECIAPRPPLALRVSHPLNAGGSQRDVLAGEWERGVAEILKKGWLKHSLPFARKTCGLTKNRREE